MWSLHSKKPINCFNFCVFFCEKRIRRLNQNGKNFLRFFFKIKFTIRFVNYFERIFLTNEIEMFYSLDENQYLNVNMLICALWSSNSVFCGLHLILGSFSITFFCSFIQFTAIYADKNLNPSRRIFSFISQNIPVLIQIRKNQIRLWKSINIFMRWKS